MKRAWDKEQAERFVESLKELRDAISGAIMVLEDDGATEAEGDEVVERFTKAISAMNGFYDGEEGVA